MNVLLICGKEMQKNLENMCSRARNKRVIGTVTQVDNNIVELVKTTYRPHCIIWAQGIDFKTDTSELDLILALQNEFPSTRIIVNHGKSDELTTSLIENDIYDVVARVVTDIEFLDLLNTPLSSKEEYERFNRDTHKAKSATVKTRKKVVVNNKPIFIFVAVIMLFTILFVLFVKNKQANNKPNESATELSTAVATEYVTDYLVIDDRYEFPTEEETEEATEKATEETTEKPTEKPTEKKDKEDEEDKNEQDNNSNTSQTQVQQPQQQYVQQPAQEQQQTTSQVQQPVQEPQQSVPQEQQPVQEQQQSAPQVQQPVQQPEPIVDDGLIHFDKDSYTVKAGETFDIYVTGLSASSGCKWELTNSAVAEFVSSDTTKVTIKAKAKGVTVVTGTAKSNGATRQVLVTVE
ncbi:MAG: hypothetical protein UH241_02845 [Acutalibacteraceae bacterium]|nr:hypothetical protein [Acutalibacteraceae bacterium]